MPVWLLNAGMPPKSSEYFTFALVLEVRVTDATVAVTLFDIGELAWLSITPAKVLPFCNRAIFCLAGVEPVKNVTQSVLILVRVAAAVVDKKLPEAMARTSTTTKKRPVDLWVTALPPFRIAPGPFGGDQRSAQHHAM